MRKNLVLFILVASAAGAVWGRPFFLPGSPRFITLPADSTVDVIARGTVPNWTGTFTSSGTTYTFTMVGTDPSLGSAMTTTPVQIIPVIFQFSNGVTVDSTQNSCGDTDTAVHRVLNSPLFQSTAFAPGGTNVGTTQYEDAFQRANFWNLVSTTAPNYHVLLSSTLQPTVTITIPANDGTTVAGPCSAAGSVNNGQIGLVSVNYFQQQLRKIAKQYPSNTLPLLLFYNTFFYQGTQNNCCILGFHTAFGFGPNKLTTAVAAFSDPGIFDAPIQDIHALSHELGEWMDDPFVSNTVPGWTGGQVSTCSTLLEVGDPVTGIAFQVNLNGFTYHPEDLVFLPWFEKALAPTSSVNGWYTFLNSYSSPSVLCN